MHPAIIGTVRSLIVDVAIGRYHVPQNVFLVLINFNFNDVKLDKFYDREKPRWSLYNYPTNVA